MMIFLFGSKTVKMVTRKLGWIINISHTHNYSKHITKKCDKAFYLCRLVIHTSSHETKCFLWVWWEGQDQAQRESRERNIHQPCPLILSPSLVDPTAQHQSFIIIMAYLSYVMEYCKRFNNFYLGWIVLVNQSSSYSLFTIETLLNSMNDSILCLQS